jgi:SulP family sulfate permease
MIALWEAKRAGRMGKAHWSRNIVAGIIVGVVALPLAMAFAIASGAKPEQGLYTAIVAGMIVSIFGGSRVQIAGPTGAFVVILASITAQYGIAGLQLATMMAGALLMIAGFARLGGLIKFIPAPVIVGFTSGIAVVIFVGQWPAFLGLPAATAPHFHEKLWQSLLGLADFHGPTTWLGLLSLALVVATPKIPWLKRIPGPLLALVVVTALHAAFQFNGVATIGSAFGGIPRGLPAFQLPDFSATQVISLIGPAFTIAMLGSIESLLSAVVADGMAQTRHDSNQELIGQGLANFAAPLFGGFAATGAIARTATSVRSGGNSPIAGLVHVATLALTLILLAPLAEYVPLATLAAILFVVAWNMSEIPRFIKLATRAPIADVVILLTTFTLTVFVDLVVAVNVGVILATLHFLRRMSGSVEVKQQTASDLRTELAKHGHTELPANVLIYSVEGPIFFGMVEQFEHTLAVTHQDPRTLIIRLGSVPFIDATALQALEDVITHLQQRRVLVILAEANERVRNKLQRAGIVDLIGGGNLASSIDEAIAISANPTV